MSFGKELIKRLRRFTANLNDPNLFVDANKKVGHYEAAPLIDCKPDPWQGYVTMAPAQFPISECRPPNVLEQTKAFAKREQQ